MCTNKERGMTLIETMVVMAMSAAVVVSAATLSVPWLARENMRSAISEIQSTMQMARVEAVKRNWDCRMEISTENRTLKVYDQKGTTGTTDDELLYTVQLPETIHFTTPDDDDAVTLEVKDKSTFQVVFNSAGTVESGQGEIVMYGGGEYKKVSLYGAGGMDVAKWNHNNMGWQKPGNACNNPGNGNTCLEPLENPK